MLRDNMIENMVGRQLLKVYYLRIKRDPTALARLLGVRVGEKGEILGDPFCIFGTEPWLITLGNHVRVTTSVKFLTHEGAAWVARGLKEEMNNYDKFGPIVIGDNVMIGMSSIIMLGVTVGDNVIIAAGSIVTKNVPSDSVVGGVPAKKISELDGFIEKIRDVGVPTKKMTQMEKREYLIKHKPEWFV